MSSMAAPQKHCPSVSSHTRTRTRKQAGRVTQKKDRRLGCWPTPSGAIITRNKASSHANNLHTEMHAFVGDVGESVVTKEQVSVAGGLVVLWDTTSINGTQLTVTALVISPCNHQTNTPIIMHFKNQIKNELIILLKAHERRAEKLATCEVDRKKMGSSWWRTATRRSLAKVCCKGVRCRNRGRYVIGWVSWRPSW